ncbi:hypothetical protein GW17_00004501 [Ensete ventricosum]|nr:hypothetical protein GW17_00004501 [Ensete ventricosum]
MSEAPAAKNMEKTSSELSPDLFMEILSWIPARALLKLRSTSVLTFYKHSDRAFLSLLDVVDVPCGILPNPSNPSPPERSCEPVISAAFRFPQSPSVPPPAENTETMELPSDLFMEILSWIPARALLKLRCVCKCWYSITTDPVFVRLHLQQQQLLPQVTSVLTFHRDFTNDRSLLSCLDVVDAPWIAKNVAIWHSDSLPVISLPCHGLFCLYHTYMEFDVCLYNPATRKSFSLPQNFTSVDVVSSDFCLVYHPVSKQYKVIHMFSTLSTMLLMEALTVGGSTWRKVGVSSALAKHTLLSRGRLSGNGTVSWLAQNNTLGDTILSLDLEDERLIEIPFPDIEHLQERGNTSLTEMEGTVHLAIHWYANVDLMDIWMLQESGAHPVWIHKFHLHLCALAMGKRFVERVIRPPMPLLINQGNILIYDCRRLVYYDLTSKGLRHEVVFHACHDFFAFVNVESLISF